MQKIRIVSDGTAIGTKVYSGETEILGITKIEIESIIPGGTVIAKLTFVGIEVDLEAKISD